MVDTEDTRWTTDNAGVWHKLPTGEVKILQQRLFSVAQGSPRIIISPPLYAVEPHVHDIYSETCPNDHLYKMATC